MDSFFFLHRQLTTKCSPSPHPHEGWASVQFFPEVSGELFVGISQKVKGLPWLL